MKPFDGSPGLWLYGLGFSAILAMVAMYFLPLSKEQKYYKEIYSYLGFLMSIAWIYATANEIISVMTMVGVVTGLSQELLGLTVMSWSDCIGDIVADIAVIKQGYPKMAMAAAIGGPLFSKSLEYIVKQISGDNLIVESASNLELNWEVEKSTGGLQATVPGLENTIRNVVPEFQIPSAKNFDIFTN